MKIEEKLYILGFALAFVVVIFIAFAYGFIKQTERHYKRLCALEVIVDQLKYREDVLSNRFDQFVELTIEDTNV